MTNKKIEALQNWFDKLDVNDKKEVIKFLYGENRLSVGTFDSVYLGPLPEIANEGLYLGPPPQWFPKSCPKCGTKL